MEMDIEEGQQAYDFILSATARPLDDDGEPTSGGEHPRDPSGEGDDEMASPSPADEEDDDDDDDA